MCFSKNYVIILSLLILIQTLSSLSYASQNQLHNDSSTISYPPMPEAVTNNAVTQVTIHNRHYLLSFSGLGAKKDYRAVHNKAFLFDVKNHQWKTISPVPLSKSSLLLTKGLSGRLASVATAIGNKAYIFGGYTVAKDHQEVSIADIYSYNLLTDQYKPLAPITIAVDDTVALAYQKKYIYLISGWHNSGNINLVQLYNIKTDQWQQATPFPGNPVFGHAGGIVNNQFVICDGVAIQFHKNKRRSYKAESACYLGIINPLHPASIDWRIIQHPSAKPKYRMAAKGLPKQQLIVFVGGSETPYNYNGIGYNTKPAESSDSIWIYHLKTNRWQIVHSKTATMDHRGLLYLNKTLITLGGMDKNQQVLKSINHDLFESKTK